MPRSIPLCLLLAACSTASVLPGQAPPPPHGDLLTLEVSELVRGRSMSVTVTHAPPGQRVFLLTSTAGLGEGPCDASLDGLCADVLSPTLGATLRADATGTATFRRTLPAAWPAATWAVQAVTTGLVPQKSTALLRQVHDPAPNGTPCVSLQPAFATPDATTLFVPAGHDPAAPFASERLRMRPVTLTANLSGLSGTVDLPDDTLLYADDGTSLPDGWAWTDADLPITVYVAATSPTSGPLTVRASGGSCVEAQLQLSSARVHLAGRSLDAWPHFEHVLAVQAGEALEVSLDPVRHADRLGLDMDLVLVPHRTPSDWAADPTLRPVVPAVRATLQAGSTRDNTWTLWTPEAADAASLIDAFDIVVDVDRNGRLDAGELIGGLGQPDVALLGDLTQPGPWPVRQQTKNYTRAWRDKRVYAPRGLQPGQQLPLVFISHGNGHDYRWYDYLGEHLASWGFVVVSHDSNTFPGPDAAAVSLRDNIDHFHDQLDDWFNGTLVDRLDGSIALIGHSRGGEAVLRVVDDLVEGDWVSDHVEPGDIKVVSSIAPTVFVGSGESDAHDVPLHVFVGTSDGDVTQGADCSPCQSLRVLGFGEGRRHRTMIQGAAHNDFHNGGGWDDGVGPNRIGKHQTQLVTKATSLALLRWYMNGDTVMAEFFERGFDGMRPVGVGQDVIVASSWTPGSGDDVRILDDFQTAPVESRSSSGGAVRWQADAITEDRLDDRDASFTSGGDPMNGMTEAASDGDQRGVVIEWSGHGYYELELPAGERDLRAFDHLMFRATQQTRHQRTDALDAPLSVGITLRDGMGRTSTYRHGLSNRLTRPYQRSGLGFGRGWANEWSTVRVRLDDLLRDGNALDLSDITAVRFELGSFYGAWTGRIGLDDILFTTEALPPGGTP